MAASSPTRGRHRARSSPTLSHRVEYLGFRIVRRLLLLLPEPVALGLGEALGWVVGTVFRVRREVVEENLARAFPDRDPAWRRRIAAASYRHLGREGVAIFRMAGTSPERIRDVTEVDGLDELRTAMEGGRGIVMATGHLGNWEMGGAAVAARGVPVDAVVQLQRNQRFDEDLRRTRERLGMRIMSKQSAPREVLRSLRQGHLAALVADQNVLRGAVFVPFFGTPAATARGPAVFALRTGAPLWVGAAFRVSRSPQRYRVVLRPVHAELTGDQEEDVRRLTAAHIGVMESWIREAPEQYFWLHKRWKTRPPIPEPDPGSDDISS